MYFACQAMAAEMSTGLLAMGYIDSHSQEISMLVLDLSCSLLKKQWVKFSLFVRMVLW